MPLLLMFIFAYAFAMPLFSLPYDTRRHADIAMLRLRVAMPCFSCHYLRHCRHMVYYDAAAMLLLMLTHYADFHAMKSAGLR